jgi:hypothetical protein
VLAFPRAHKKESRDRVAHPADAVRPVQEEVAVAERGIRGSPLFGLCLLTCAPARSLLTMRATDLDQETLERVSAEFSAIGLESAARIVADYAAEALPERILRCPYDPSDTTNYNHWQAAYDRRRRLPDLKDYPEEKQREIRKRVQDAAINGPRRPE